MNRVVMKNKNGEVCCELVYDGSYWRFPDNYDTDYPFEIGDTFKIVETEDTEDQLADWAEKYPPFFCIVFILIVKNSNLRSIFICFVYIYFVRNVHFSTKNVDNLPQFMIVVHKKRGQVNVFYDLSTENVDKLKTMDVMCVVNSLDCM